MIQIKRVYDPPSPEDGRRFFVERLWPRGLRKEALQAEWIKDVAPSPELRRWYGHEVELWDQFQRRYRKELDLNPAAWQPIKAAARRGPVTLLYAAHDTLHNSALVLRDYLGGAKKRRRTTTKKK